MELRPYQTEAITAVLKRKAAGITRQLVALPTGTGKTVVFARKDAAWREHPASQKQIELLKKLGLYRGRTTKGQASDLLDKFFASRPNQRSAKSAIGT